MIVFTGFHAEDCFFNAAAFAFDSIHEAAGPYELSGEEAQAEEDRHPAWAGRNEHDGSQSKQSETGEDAEGAANLLERRLEHDLGHEPPY